ncbi:hypothetical protein HMPREF9702_02553 [Delftia acidovorans CCUG 15835]|nr:hypothetical protein HMPREF9702_02553 [Delftia acidovorans CCUG 15835]
MLNHAGEHHDALLGAETDVAPICLKGDPGLREANSHSPEPCEGLQQVHFLPVPCTTWISRACRRDAPSGFRAAPHAAVAVTAIRLQSLTPSRLRCSALRLPPGESPAGYPRRTMLGAPRCSRTGCAGSARPAARRDGRGAGEHAGACCGRLCKCVSSSTLAVPACHVTKDGSRTGKPARHRYGASTPRLKTGTERCGRGVLACRRVVDLTRVSGRTGAALVRGCRAGPISFRSGSAQGALVSL